MINLFQYLTEGIFDIDDNIDNVEKNSIAKKWIHQQSLSDNIYTSSTEWKILKDSTVQPISGRGGFHIDGNIPREITIVDAPNGASPSIGDATIECLDSIKCKRLDIANTKILDYGHGFNGEEIFICNVDIEDFKWFPKKLQYLNIKQLNMNSYDFEGLIVERNATLEYLRGNETLENIKVKGDLYISSCRGLKYIKNIECNNLLIFDCANFEGFEGDNKINTISTNAACKKFKPINLPKNLENIYCSELGKDWVETNVMELNPDLKLKTKGFPDARQWKSDIDLYQPGVYVCAKSKPRSYSGGRFSPTRGTLAIDQVVKVTPSGRIKCDYSGLRPAMDVELMRDANPKKDWNYKDPNGLNDITGVGIEIGDEVIVYEKGQGHLSIDIVSGLTKAKIRCEKNGLRSPEDICIMRGQKECKKLFK